MSKAMVYVLKNILKYERSALVMTSYNKVALYDANEGAYFGF